MNNIRVRLPRKLAKSVSGGVLAEVGRLNPVGAMGITLNMLPLHRVTMTLSENDLPLAMHDLVEVYNHKGSVGIYRVTKNLGKIKKHRKIELSHGLDVLSDSTFDYIEEYKGTVDGMLAKIISAQTQMIGGVKYWRLGVCEDTNPWNKDIKYDNLMECLTEIAKKEEDYMFTFDQSTFPWTVNFVARNNDVLSEFRLNRNTENCDITEDDSDLCTRLYLSVTSETNDDEGHGTYINEGYFTYNDTDAQNAGFGVVCKTAGVNQEDFTSQAALEAWVAAYFGRHNRPGVQITLDGVELNRLTNETIDEVHLARICRVALPEYSCTFNERIVSVNYPDALRKPLYVRSSLANKRQTAEDAFSEIKNTATSATKSASGAGRSAHNDATYFRRTIGDTANGLYSRIEQTAYYIRSEVVDTANGLYSKIEQTASYIRSEVANTANGLNSKIEQTASYIRSEVSNTANGLYSKIEQTASAIRSEVSNTANGIYSRIEQTASSWSAKISGVVDSNGNVTAASIAVAINNAGEGVATINASKIYLLGQTIADTITADYISTKIASLSVLNVGAISATGNITTTNGVVMAPYIYLGTTGSTRSLANAITALRIELSGNTYTLQKQDFDDNSWVDVGTFSRATTLTGAWSSGKFTVSASPQGESFWTDLVQGTVTWNGTDGTIPINAIDKDSGGNAYFTGRNVAVDASSIYQNASPVSGTAVSRHGTAWNWDFSIKRGDNTSKTITIDVSDIVVAAREGYTLGTFTQATVTPQGESDSVYVEVSSGGTNYYKAGTKTKYRNAGKTYTYYAAGSSATYYNAGTSTKTAIGTSHTPSKKTGYYRGDKVTGTNQGTKWNSSTYPLYYKYNGSYIAISAALYYAGSSYEYYKGGSYFTFYDVGTSSVLYEAGSSFTVQGTQANVTTQGQEVSVTVQGSEVEVTPISGNALMLAATTRYKAGTPDSTTYYTKS